MAGITRATAAIFSTTGLTPTAGFGAAANGTTTTEAGTSNSVSNIQTGTSGAWAGGWISAVLGASKFPAVEDMNAINNVFSTQIAYILERGIPEYDAGTSYNTGDIARGIGLTTLYASVGNGNIGNALSNATYWTFLCDLAGLTASVFTGGTSTGSANAQTLASVVPASGLTPSNGQTIIFTAGYTNTGSATLAITAPSIGATAIKKDSGSGLVNLVAGDITAGDTIYVSWNSTSSVWVLTSGLALGALAYLGLAAPSGLLYSSGGNLNSYVPTTISGNLPTAMSGTNTTAAITVSAGQCSDSTNATQMQGAGYSWAASNGNAINGTDAGSSTLANSTTYHMFLCSGASGTGTFASASLTPTFPTGYATYKRRIFSFTTNSSGAPLVIAPVEIAGGGMDVVLSAGATAQTASVSGTASTVTITNVPTGITVKPNIRIANQTSSQYVLVSSLAASDLAPNNGGTAPGNSCQNPGGQTIANPNIITNTSAQIRARASGSDSLYIYLDGWQDFRRT